MAAGAGDLAMSAIEQESGPLMVEIPDAPVTRVVAAGAARSQPSLVRVLLRMAGHAFLARILEPGACMTGIALDCNMAPREREFRSSVVKTCLVPGCFGMATLALGPFLPGMAIVFPMAGNALRGNLLPERRISVTSLASHGGVAAA